MKDIILISAYCPDVKRQTLLKNLVNSIPSDRFDVLITSHTPIPQNIQDKVNYVFYDQENTLYHDMESSPFYWLELQNKKIIYHTKLHHPLHILAILRLKRFGYQIAKMLGYNKLHCLEYDTLVLNPQIFFENSYLLNTYDAVVYENEDLSKNSIHGGFKSLRINSLSKDLIDYNEEKIKNYFKFSKKRILPEQYAFDLFAKLNTFFIPSQKLKNYIELNKYSSPNEESYIIIPYVKDKVLTLYYINHSKNEPIDFTLQLNNQTQHITINPLSWTILPLGLYEDFSYIKVTIQDKVYFELDLNIDNNREIFLKRHYFTTDA